jgi:hypothetical protein
MAVETAGAPVAGYPLRFEVEYPERLSRLLIFVKWLLAIPHFFVLYVLLVIAGALTFIAFLAILFTGRYPKGLFNFVVNVYRWNANVNAYAFLMMRDEYPPFSWEPGKYPLTFEVDHPERLSRWLPFVKWLLAFPHYIVLFFLYLIFLITLTISWFAILITGRYPQALFRFHEGIARWGYRVNAYTYLLRDEYPPFSLK